MSNLSQTPFAHATRLIKHRNSMISFTLFRRARIETCLSSLTFAQFLILISVGKVFADFPRCAKYIRFQLARDESSASRPACAERTLKNFPRYNDSNPWKAHHNVYTKYSEDVVEWNITFSQDGERKKSSMRWPCR